MTGRILRSYTALAEAYCRLSNARTSNKEMKADIDEVIENIKLCQKQLFRIGEKYETTTEVI